MHNRQSVVGAILDVDGSSNLLRVKITLDTRINVL